MCLGKTAPLCLGDPDETSVKAFEAYACMDEGVQCCSLLHSKRMEEGSRIAEDLEGPLPPIYHHDGYGCLWAQAK